MTKIKILFNVPRTEDSERMAKMMYGGEIDPKDAAYVARQLKKQYAIIKNNKKSPLSFNVKDVHTPQYDDKIRFAFKEKIYTSNPWYISLASAKGEINNKFGQRTTRQFGGGPERAEAGTTTPYIQEPNRPDQNPVNEGTSERREGTDTGTRKKVERKKGIPATLLSERPRDDEPLGE